MEDPAGDAALQGDAHFEKLLAPWAVNGFEAQLAFGRLVEHDRSRFALGELDGVVDNRLSNSGRSSVDARVRLISSSRCIRPSRVWRDEGSGIATT